MHPMGETKVGGQVCTIGNIYSIQNEKCFTYTNRAGNKSNVDDSLQTKLN